MNNSYDQRYISIDILLKKSQILSMHLQRIPKIKTVAFSIFHSNRI